jgi:RNA polymerase sigma factor (TIGR02999 family)
MLAQEKTGQTLRATDLVHEVYIRLVDIDKDAALESSRRHFFGAASEAMRRILIEQARVKAGPVADGAHWRVELSVIEAWLPGPRLDVLELSESLDRLAADYARVAELVKLPFFVGLTRQ